jgi:hypothetical protein
VVAVVERAVAVPKHSMTEEVGVWDHTAPEHPQQQR